MAGLELWPSASAVDCQNAIRAVYKQVLGNPHVMESERLVSAESQLTDGGLSLREFVRAVGLSPFYRSRYFERCAPYRFVELNFMHFLGRSPESQQEVAEHIIRTVEEGFEAEVNSYLDSQEYQDNFGESSVPFLRGARTENGLKQLTFNRMFAVDRGPAQVSSAVKSSQLVYAIAANSSGDVKRSSATVNGSGTEKRFKITVSGAKFDSPRRLSTTEYIVPASKMTPQIQRINRNSGKIVAISEIT
jgi:phycoerythrin-associated linker protein